MSFNVGDAAALRKKWGDKPCEHPKLMKEYYLGSQTGDYICTTCGQEGWGRDWNKATGAEGTPRDS